MFNIYFKNSLNKKNLIVFLFLYLLLLLGFFWGENSTGGAVLDYINQKKASQAFANNFLETLLNYDNFGTRHSPVLIIFLSFLEKFNLNDVIIRLIYLHICLTLPFIFLSILKLRFPKIENNYFYILIGIIFLSPTFRTLSIWPDSRLWGLIFFSLSIYYYLKFITNKNYLYCQLNVFTCAFSAYLSPNFAVFSIFFFYNFLIHFLKDPKKIFFIILANITLAIPFFYYVFILDVNFLNKPAATNFDKNNIFFSNIFNSFYLIISIIFFYLLPFLVTRIFKINKKLNFKNIILSLMISVLSIFFFDYKYEYTGGGILFKFSYFIFKNNYLFYFFCFLSIYFFLETFKKNYQNYFLFVLLILNNPQVTVYHKYYDPFLLILFFSILIIDIDFNRLNFKSNVITIYIFFLFFLILSNIKFLWMI